MSIIELEKLTSEFENLITKMKNTDFMVSEDKLLDYVIESEKLSLQFRNYYFLLNKKDDLFARLIHDLNSTISFDLDTERNIYKIVFPTLICNKRSKKDINNFIFSILFNLLKLNRNKINKFSKGTISFVFYYPSNATYSDYDNLEVKKAIDTISPFFFIDDSPKYLNTMFSSIESDENKMEIYVFGDDIFLETKKMWVVN